MSALKEVKHLCKELGFTAVILKGALAVGRKTKEKVILWSSQIVLIFCLRCLPK